MAAIAEPVTVFDCAECGQTVTRVPVRDDGQVWWLGLDNAESWCSETCRETTAQRHAEGWG